MAGLTRGASSVLAFDPPADAEPEILARTGSAAAADAAAAAEAAAAADGGVPRVLSKLQKWGDYPSYGEPVAPTCFLPMKTPMSREIVASWSLPAPPAHALTLRGLLAAQAAAGRRVGLVVDLANHECLYADDLADPAVAASGLEYAHVQLVAKVLPPRAAVDAVAAAAAAFWARRPGDLVAIHCAYGFNRTGFVVCSYLCQALGMAPGEALDAFAAARPPGVKHGKFVNELFARYGGGAAPPAEEEGARAAEEDEGARGVEALAAALGGADLAGGGGLPSPPVEIARRTSSRSPAARSDSFSAEAGDAGGAAAGAGAASGGDCAGEEALRAAAARLDSRSSLRHETSLGLARALAEDFGVHDGTPVQHSPAGGAYTDDEAEEEGEEGRRAAARAGAFAAAPAAGLGPASPPRAGPAAPPRPASASALASYAEWRAAAGPLPGAAAPLAAHRGAGGMPRNVSVDSDCHSLGFGARQALHSLRHGAFPDVAAPAEGEEEEEEEEEEGGQCADGMPRVASHLGDIDPADWDHGRPESPAPPRAP
jgi:protein-tyrosine phosphatase